MILIRNIILLIFVITMMVNIETNDENTNLRETSKVSRK